MWKKLKPKRKPLPPPKVKLSPEAIGFLKEHVLASSKLPEGAGLRIFVKRVETPRNRRSSISLGSAIVERPEERDRMVEQDGVLIFLDAGATRFLHEQTLDINVEGTKLRFKVSPTK